MKQANTQEKSQVTTTSEVLQFEIAKLELHPGDIVAIRFPVGATYDQIDEMIERLGSLLPDGVRGIAYQNDIELSVIRPNEQHA